jgi:hypothetical protein
MAGTQVIIGQPGPLPITATASDANDPYHVTVQY